MEPKWSRLWWKRDQLWQARISNFTQKFLTFNFTFPTLIRFSGYSFGASKGWGDSRTAMLNDRLRSGCSRHPITCRPPRYRHPRRVHPSPTRSRPPPRLPRGPTGGPASWSSRTRGLVRPRRGLHRRPWPPVESPLFEDAASRDHRLAPNPGRSPLKSRTVVGGEETNDEVRFIRADFSTGERNFWNISLQ